MKPADALNRTKRMAASMRKLRGARVAVGLPVENVGGKVYGDGRSIIAVGATHEFGAGPIPQRSFLRVPFQTKRKTLNKQIAQQFSAVSGGLDPDVGLGRIGATAVNVSKGAFTSLGYGDWDPIDPATAAAKGSSQTLIDTGILRGSISWVIR